MSITFWICSSPAFGSITMTMASDLLLVISGWYFVAFKALDTPRFVEDAFEQSLHRIVAQRASIGRDGLRHDRQLTSWIVDLEAEPPLHRADGQRASRPLVEKLQKPAIQLVDAAAQLLDFLLVLA